MPPKRRTSGPASTSRTQRSQGTLSFNKDGRNRVTKPGATQRQDKISKKDPALLDITPADAEPDLDEPTTAEVAIAEQTAAAIAEPDPLASDVVKAEDVLGGRAPQSETGAVGGKTGSGWQADEETQARKITESQIKTYWRKKEQERKAPRVHQEGLGTVEKVLREFDMSGQFGPCIGIARLKRWKRANMLGLHPPMEVLAILLKENDKNNVRVQRAYVDELLSSRFIET